MFNEEPMIKFSIKNTNYDLEERTAQFAEHIIDLVKQMVGNIGGAEALSQVDSPQKITSMLECTWVN